jgi:acylphosphatase
MLPDTARHFDLCRRRAETELSAVSIPLAAGPLLQSRGCNGKIVRDRLQLEMHAKRFYVSGRVQGVGFRFFAEGTASRLGVGGYVKNLFDGRVEVYAIGDEQQLRALRDALEQGPRTAAIDEVEERDAEILKEYASGFTIEHDY